jgi:hypothetical protein
MEISKAGIRRLLKKITVSANYITATTICADNSKLLLIIIYGWQPFTDTALS